MRALKNLLLAENTYVFLISVLLISIPFRYAFSSIALIVLTVVSFASLRYHKLDRIRGIWIPMVLFCFMVLSLSWSLDVSKSIRGIERQLPFLILPLSFMFMPKLSKLAFRNISYIFAWAWALLALIFISYSAYLYLDKQTLGVFYYHFLVSPLDLNAIYVSVMVSLSLLFLIFYGKRRPLDIIAGGILAVFLLLLSSKNVVFITFLSLVLGILLFRKHSRKQWLIFIVLGIIAGYFLVKGPIYDRWEQEFEADIEEVFTKNDFGIFYPWTGTTIRLFQIRMFAEMMEEDAVYFTGYGLNAAQDKIADRQQPYNLYCGFAEYNFHNQYIQTFAELGIGGTLLLLALISYLLLHFWKSKELFPLFVFLIMTSVFFTETYVWRQRGMIHFLVIFGLILKCLPMVSNKKIAA